MRCGLRKYSDVLPGSLFWLRVDLRADGLDVVDLSADDQVEAVGLRVADMQAVDGGLDDDELAGDVVELVGDIYGV